MRDEDFIAGNVSTQFVKEKLYADHPMRHCSLRRQASHVTRRTACRLCRPQGSRTGHGRPGQTGETPRRRRAERRANGSRSCSIRAPSEESGLFAVSHRKEVAERTPADGKIAGYGKVQARKVAVVANDFTVMGASSSVVNGKKIRHMREVGHQERPAADLPG